MSSLNNSGSSENKTGSGRKRQYTRPNDEEEDGPKKHRGSSKVPTTSGTYIRRLACPYHKKIRRGAYIRKLACPYHKSDPRGHRKCAKRSFSKPSYVKAHIYKCHIQPEYCTLCGTTFKDGQSRDDPEAVTQCPNQPHYVPDGVDSKGESRLRKRPYRLTVEEQWFAIFDIACPDQPHPPSPYHEPEVCPCCEKISDLRGFATGNSDTETLSKTLRQSKEWRPESEALLRESLSHWLGNPSDQCTMLQNDVPEEIVGEDAPEASLDSNPNFLNSSEPVPSEYTDDRHIPGSASPIASAQPILEAREDASCALEVPQIPTSLQASIMSGIPLQDNSLDSYLSSHTIPNLDTVTEFGYSFDDFPEFALLDNFVNDGGDGPSTDGYCQ